MISAVAIYYSVEGLVAIYPAMVVPIVIMGIAIELGKLSLTVWLKENWDKAPGFLKSYMLPAVAVLMLITSVGVFGFLSKAHSDQTLVSGDVQSRLAIYDEKIKTAKENIESDRKQIKQMDDAVDQIMARSQNEQGADRSNSIRKSQSRDRIALAKDIETNQKVISQLNDEAAPIRAQARKVEADVGPIKYIAAFIYGSNPDANVLEKAVTWITILIVIVLDPLAVVLLLASQYSFAWDKEQKLNPVKYPQDDGPLTDDQIEQIKADELLHAGVTNSDPDDNVPVVVRESFEGVKDPVTGEWIQTGPSFEYEAPVHETNTDNPIDFPKANYYTAGSSESVLSPEEEEAWRDLEKQQSSFKPATVEYKFVDEDSGEIDYTVTSPESTEETEGDDPEYVRIDGQLFHRNAVPTEYKIRHLKDSVVLQDENGNETEHPIAYIQNEEQSESNKWMNIVESTKAISQQEYLSTVKTKTDGR